MFFGFDFIAVSCEEEDVDVADEKQSVSSTVSDGLNIA